MNVTEVFRTLDTQEQAIEYLEKVRWAGHPLCPYCNSVAVGRHASSDRSMARWQCRNCTRTFAVTVGTPFHGTHVPLRDWFLVLALMLNAKKPASASKISRDLSIRRATVWSMMQRAKAAMAADPVQKTLLHKLVEADDTYHAAKSREGNEHSDDKPTMSGGDTKTMSAIGAIERGGRVFAKVASRRKPSIKGISELASQLTEAVRTLLDSDGYREAHLVQFAPPQPIQIYASTRR